MKRLAIILSVSIVLNEAAVFACPSVPARQTKCNFNSSEVLAARLDSARFPPAMRGRKASLSGLTLLAAAALSLHPAAAQQSLRTATAIEQQSPSADSEIDDVLRRIESDLGAIDVDAHLIVHQLAAFGPHLNRLAYLFRNIQRDDTFGPDIERWPGEAVAYLFTVEARHPEAQAFSAGGKTWTTAHLAEALRRRTPNPTLASNDPAWLLKAFRRAQEFKNINPFIEKALARLDKEGNGWMIDDGRPFFDALGDIVRRFAADIRHTKNERLQLASYEARLEEMRAGYANRLRKLASDGSQNRLATPELRELEQTLEMALDPEHLYFQKFDGETLSVAVTALVRNVDRIFSTEGTRSAEEEILLLAAYGVLTLWKRYPGNAAPAVHHDFAWIPIGVLGAMALTSFVQGRRFGGETGPRPDRFVLSDAEARMAVQKLRGGGVFLIDRPFGRLLLIFRNRTGRLKGALGQMSSLRGPLGIDAFRISGRKVEYAGYTDAELRDAHPEGTIAFSDNELLGGVVSSDVTSRALRTLSAAGLSATKQELLAPLGIVREQSQDYASWIVEEHQERGIGWLLSGLLAGILAEEKVITWRRLYVSRALPDIPGVVARQSDDPTGRAVNDIACPRYLEFLRFDPTNPSHEQTWSVEDVLPEALKFLQTNPPRVLLITGPPKSRKSAMANRLLDAWPDRFARVVGITDRPSYEDENPSAYHFVTPAEMDLAIHEGWAIGVQQTPVGRYGFEIPTLAAAVKTGKLLVIQGFHAAQEIWHWWPGAEIFRVGVIAPLTMIADRLQHERRGVSDKDLQERLNIAAWRINKVRAEAHFLVDLGEGLDHAYAALESYALEAAALRRGA